MYCFIYKKITKKRKKKRKNCQPHESKAASGYHGRNHNTTPASQQIRNPKSPFSCYAYAYAYQI